MGTRSTIMDTNSFRPEHAAELDQIEPSVWAF